jgi:hypothetical protein
MKTFYNAKHFMWIANGGKVFDGDEMFANNNESRSQCCDVERQLGWQGSGICIGTEFDEGCLASCEKIMNINLET